jgi:(2Fe-2S) ferredoxin
MVNIKRHVFVCSGGKPAGDKKGLCHTRDSGKIMQKFAEELDGRELSSEVMLSACTCFGICAKGPIVVVYPDGIWYGGVAEGDVAEIAENHLEGGSLVKRLLI